MSDDAIIKEIKKASARISILIALVSIVISGALSYGIYYAFYHNYTVLLSSVAGKQIPLPLNLIGAFVVGAILLGFGLKLLLREKLVLKSISDENISKAKKLIKKDNKLLAGSSKSWLVGAFVTALGFVAIAILSVHCFGYNDEGVRFSDSHNIVVVSGEYQDFGLFKLDSYRDSAGREYSYGDNAYALVRADGKASYELGNLDNDTGMFLLLKYGCSYTQVQNMDEAINFVKEMNSIQQHGNE